MVFLEFYSMNFYYIEYFERNQRSCALPLLGNPRCLRHWLRHSSTAGAHLNVAKKLFGFTMNVYQKSKGEPDEKIFNFSCNRYGNRLPLFLREEFPFCCHETRLPHGNGNHTW
jgi:hypothetical protein